MIQEKVEQENSYLNVVMLIVRLYIIKHKSQSDNWIRL
jgi:hypothetical protein